MYQKRQRMVSPCPSSLSHLGFHRSVSRLPKLSLLQTGKSLPTQIFLVQKPFQAGTILVVLLWTCFQVLLYPFWDGRRWLHTLLKVQANYGFVKTVADYRIAFFFSFVLSSFSSPLSFMLFESRLSVSLESVQSPRKKQRTGTHIICSHVLGSDCDSAV